MDFARKLLSTHNSLALFELQLHWKSRWDSSTLEDMDHRGKCYLLPHNKTLVYMEYKLQDSVIQKHYYKYQQDKALEELYP